MKDKKICILTVVDSISATSMPVNEFVLYRQHNGYPYRQVLIVCCKGGDEKVEIPNDIVTYYVGSDVKEFRLKLKEIKEECDGREESLVCHLHGQKSALVTEVAR